VLISAVNWAEVLYRVLQVQGNVGVDGARKLEDQSPLKVVEVDRSLAEISAQLKLTYGLPLSDAFCAALAKKERAVLVTSDRDFEAVKGEVKKIVWLGKE
jgi:predicted nucleic acid-binding protein